ncbi:iron-sulfur cluster carrier protein ApbC [Chelatococcus reniformis]|uniref:Iron-sulfur cluster carrier protein n=1 Tax=Chelatococcus reniformis TaxID=1494448 RepID=A0A916UIB2_9HYPH|nr:iron-sulfur cluster carrier protein ApbC [Chelatococcus reniformis]GGC73257.1 iron-sulfur cluster carrier protein [Chelatococcus reniformis]
MITNEHVLAALAQVAGPDGTTPLPRSGTLSDIVVTNGKVYFSIGIDPTRAAELEPMRAAAERAVKALAGVDAVVATLTAEAPAGGRAARTAPAPGRPAQAQPGPRATAARARTEVPGVKQIIAVASGKGGVGKSTTACNLALALARTGLSVGVLDADVYGPSMPRLFGISSKPELGDDRMLRPPERFGLKVMSIGFLVEDEAAIIWRGPMVMSALQQLLREVAWGALDVLVVDMPPGTGDAQLTMAQNVPLAGAVIVSTPQDLALIDARRGIAMFRKVDVPVLGIVENMSTFICPACGTRSDIFGHGGARHEAERIGVPFLGEVPLHIRIRELSDSGEPVVVADPDGPHARAYDAIAHQVASALAGEAAGRRAPPRIVIE